MTTQVKRGFFRLNGDSGAYTIIDTTHFPFMMAHWVGEGTPKLYAGLWDFRAKYAEGHVERAVWVHDLTNMKAPTATARKYVADRSTADPLLSAGKFVQVAFVSNPLLRGVLTAITWMSSKEAFPMEYAGNMKDAIAIAKKLLDQVEVPYDDNFTDYKFVPTEFDSLEFIDEFDSTP